MDADAGRSTESPSGAGYDFHDPAFVTWWLDSLYLLPVEDQIAIAQGLLSAVHAPGSRSEIEAFLEVQSQQLEARAAPAAHAVDPTPWRFALRAAWRARPWLTGIGLLACAFFVLKGIWFLWPHGLGS
jgi:hypothetical protein